MSEAYLWATDLILVGLYNCGNSNAFWVTLVVCCALVTIYKTNQTIEEYKKNGKTLTSLDVFVIAFLCTIILVPIVYLIVITLNFLLPLAVLGLRAKFGF